MNQSQLAEKVRQYDIIRIEREALEREGLLESYQTALKIAEAVNSYPNIDGEFSELSFLCLPRPISFRDDVYHFPSLGGRSVHGVRELPYMELRSESCSRCLAVVAQPSALKIHGKKYPIHIKKDVISVHLIDSETYKEHNSRGWIHREEISLSLIHI